MKSIPTLQQSPGAASECRLEKAIRPMAAAHPGKSGIFALRDGRDAFAARCLLADAAERTLDVQYYIWQDDMSGRLLLQSLRRAAARGVHVRLLLDDNNTAGLDALLFSLDADPNIEVRLFNPLKIRRWRLLNYVIDFVRLNRRMHNKSFTADGQATIIGGRNIGDEYFGADETVALTDLDALAVGQVATDVSHDFDRYWNSPLSVPVTQILLRMNTTSGVFSSELLADRGPAANAYIQAINESPFVQKMLARELPFQWAVTHMISDDPAKGKGRIENERLMWPRLQRMLGTPVKELTLVSAYFVPGSAGVEYLTALSKQGVKIAVFTNSLEATDVSVTHAGYEKRRKPLLKAGIRLFEMKREYAAPSIKKDHKLSSSNSSLHAKTFMVDRARIFIGSFNFDPRSARLNTENGFVIESPVLANEIADALDGWFPVRTYEVSLSQAGALQWTEHVNGRQILHTKEPGAGFWRRVGVFIVSKLPIEWLL
jgi:putative cardiolipin synthase